MRRTTIPAAARMLPCTRKLEPDLPFLGALPLLPPAPAGCGRPAAVCPDPDILSALPLCPGRSVCPDADIPSVLPLCPGRSGRPDSDIPSALPIRPGRSGRSDAAASKAAPTALAVCRRPGAAWPLLALSASIARRVCLGPRASCPDLLVFSMDLRLVEITGRDNADPGLSLIQRDLLFLRIIIMGYTKLAVLLP